MKYLYRITGLVLGLLAHVAISQAQSPVTNQGQLYISNGTSLYINGYYNHNSSSYLANDGEIVITDSLVNSSTNTVFGSSNTAALPNAGMVKLIGLGKQRITGNTVYFYGLQLQNPANELELATNISVNGNLQLNAGNIFLNGQTIDLGINGRLAGESNTKRVYGATGQLIAQEPALSSTFNRLGLQASALDNLGTTYIYRRHEEQDGAGSGSILRYYEIVPSNPGQITNTQFRYFDSDRNGLPENELGLYLSTNDGLTWQLKGGVLNASQDIISVDSALSLTTQKNFLTAAQVECNETPVVNIGDGTVYLCQDDSLVLDAGNPSYLYAWSSGETTQQITVKTTGEYSVAVTNVNGCIGYDTVQVVVKPNPVAAFRLPSTAICFGQAATFTNQSTVSEGTLSYRWNFGDGLTLSDTSNAANPEYTYPNPGIYNVTLTVTSDYGCVREISKNVTIYGLPQPQFSAVNACQGSAVVFSNDTPGMTDGTAHDFSWNFGDGNASNDANPSHTYSTAGTYTVRLTSRTSAGCEVFVEHDVDVYEPVAADFDFVSTCPGEDVIFAQLSTVASGTLSYDWSFGDGTRSTLKSPVHAYAQAGTYNVTLQATSENGCTDIISKDLVVYEEPAPAFSVTSACANEDITLTQNTPAQGGEQYFWQFGDGTSSTRIQPTKTYATAGTYTISLRVINGSGCEETTTRSVTISPRPVAQFEVSESCAGQSTFFINRSSVNGGGLRYHWNFGDGATSTQANPQHTYASSGIYTVQLTVTSPAGCTETTSRTVEAWSYPELNLGETIQTCGSSLELNAENSGATYLWSTNATTQKITITRSGTYSVTVTNNRGCQITESVQVTLNGNVAPNLGADRTVCTETTLDAGYPGATYSWSTGETSRYLTVLQSGTYSVTVTDANGCSGTGSVQITVSNPPIANIGADREACQGESITLDAGVVAASYLWNSGETTRTITVNESGTYTVEVATTEGCSTTDEVNVKFNESPGLDLGAEIAACGPITLDAGLEAASYQWSTGATTRAITVAESGIYSLTVTNAAGCSTQDDVQVTINGSLAVDLGTDLTLCNGTTAQLDAGNPGASYRWNTGATTQTIEVGSTGEYWVKVTSVNGCTVEDRVNVTVLPVLTVDLGPDMLLCDISNTVLDAGIPGASYQWNSNVSSTGTNQTLQVQEPGKYWVTVTTSKGCTASDTIAIQAVNQPLEAVYLASSTVNVGDTVQFVNLSFPEPYQAAWEFGDGHRSSEAQPDHVFLLPGTYQVQLTVTNDYCTSSLTKTINVESLRQDYPDDTEVRFLQVNAVNLYPNPVESILNIDLELTKSASAEILVVSMNGSMLAHKVVEGKEISETIDMAKLPSGVYAVQITVGKKRIVKRVIKN